MFLKSKFILLVSLIALFIVALPVDHALAQTATGKFCVEARDGSGFSLFANVPFTVKDANGVVVGSFLTDALGIGCLDVDPGTYTAAISTYTWGGSTPSTQTATVSAGQMVTVAFRVFKRAADTSAPGNLCVLVQDDLHRTIANVGITVKDLQGTVITTLVSNAVNPQCVSIAQGNYLVLADSNPYRIVRPPNPQSAGVFGGLTTDVRFQIGVRMGAPATTIFVTPDSLNNWGIAITNNALGKFVAGPGGQPNGLKSGSVQYETKDNPGGKPQLGTLQFNGKQFDAITTLKYNTFIQNYADGGSHLTQVLNIGIDLDGNPLTTTDTATMVYEPCYNNLNGNCGVPIQQLSNWNTWDAWASGQKWWSTVAIPNTDFLVASNSFAPLTSLLANYPNATITGVSINAGQRSGGNPWNNFKGNVDGFTIAFDNAPDTVYDFDVNSPPVVAVAAPDIPNGVEGTEMTTAGKFSDPDGDPFSGWNASLGSLVHYADGSWTWKYTPTDNGTGTVTVTVSDGHGGTASDSFNYTVANVPPTITLFTASPVPTAINTKVTAKATYTDPGKDTETWLILWDDGTSSTNYPNTTSANSSIQTDHIYTAPGVYELTLQVTDKDGAFDSEPFAYVVVYDPNQPHVHGDGEFISVLGAYPANPRFTDKAHFGVNADYPKKDITPKGKFDFKLEHTNLDFHSTALDWSVVSGNQFTFKGVGKIKSVSGYGFLFSSLVSTLDGQDKVRVKIWNTATGAVIYDNQPGAPDDAVPTQLMPKGDIKIQK